MFIWLRVHCSRRSYENSVLHSTVIKLDKILACVLRSLEIFGSAISITPDLPACPSACWILSTFSAISSYLVRWMRALIRLWCQFTDAPSSAHPLREGLAKHDSSSSELLAYDICCNSVMNDICRTCNYSLLSILKSTEDSFISLEGQSYPVQLSSWFYGYRKFLDPFFMVGGRETLTFKALSNFSSSTETHCLSSHGYREICYGEISCTCSSL